MECHFTFSKTWWKYYFVKTLKLNNIIIYISVVLYRYQHSFIHSFIHILSVLSLWYHWFGFLLCCHCRDINDNSRKIIRDDVTITNIIRELYGTSGVKSNRWWAWHSTFQSSGITSLVNSTNFSKGQAGIQPGMVKRYGSWIDEFR